MKTTVLLMTMVSAWAFGPFPALAQNKSTCYMFQGSADRKNEKAYYSPIRTYQSPGLCPRRDDVRTNTNAWLPFIYEKYGLVAPISNHLSRTFCTCQRPQENGSMSAERAERFVREQRDEFFQRNRNYELIEVPDFYPQSFE